MPRRPNKDLIYNLAENTPGNEKEPIPSEEVEEAEHAAAPSTAQDATPLDEDPEELESGFIQTPKSKRQAVCNNP